jgi:hypothetical protein
LLDTIEVELHLRAATDLNCITEFDGNGDVIARFECSSVWSGAG